MKKQFENIFSSKKTEQEQKPTTPNPKTPIIIDTREKQSLIASYLLQKNANIKFEKLEIADYIIQDIGIERKTFSDFLNSMINKHLLHQLREIKKYPKHFLIIEGFNYNYHPEQTKIHENAIRGMFLSTILNFQVPIIFTQDEEDTANFLILLAKKQEKTKLLPSIRPTKSAQTLKQQKQFILEGFPGIGPTIAKQLLENFNSLEEIFTASKEQLKTITKLTEDKIEKFKQLLED
tara:strand:+ start:3852 stop:4556 length:705 start_codon:yes stop_codon:yes gene_type:complete